MVTHLTARLAWHDNGWNGRICSNPQQNTYCTGMRSYPGDLIRNRRDLNLEIQNADKAVCNLKSDELPPCIYSINAFGDTSITGYSDPPIFFNKQTKRAEWDMPASTVCAWPYEVMYNEEVYVNGHLNNDKRKEKADIFFNELTENESLIFYYANYSNPFSDENNSIYVIVGVSKIKKIGDTNFYNNVNSDDKKKYAQGVVWGRNISSNYPEEGFCIPYHLYRDKPDTLKKILVTPDNPLICKYGAHHVNNDMALGLLEQLLDVANKLQEINDTSQDWQIRKDWLANEVNRLWKKRGLYPGLLSVMSYLKASECILNAKQFCEKGEEKKAFELFFNALDDNKECKELNLTDSIINGVSREWRLLNNEDKNFLKKIAVRLDIDNKQITNILSEERKSHGITAELEEIVQNPYLLSEQYTGDAPDDIISWSTIDRGVLPSPNLGTKSINKIEKNDARRLRSLCVEQLKRASNQTFRPAEYIIKQINERTTILPEWKKNRFNINYFEVDKEIIEEALVIKDYDKKKYLYLKDVYEDERKVEKELRNLLDRPEIRLQRPIEHDFWVRTLSDETSNLYKKGGDKYTLAIKEQAEQCAQIFRLPLSVISGRAGTGKTTIISAIIAGIKIVDGIGDPIHIMTPTGKATDRVRSVLAKSDINNVSVSTIHSFLAYNGWLNENLTFKRTGGKLSAIEGTVIIDETSMLELSLAATFFRSINWQSVKRLILVGDHNQLPPIGRGRIFLDLIKLLQEKNANNLAILKTNMRQMENEIDDKGTSLLKLAEIFLGDKILQNEPTTFETEKFLQKINHNGKIDKDLKIVYWQKSDDLIESLISDFALALPAKPDEQPIYKKWQEEITEYPPEHLQILTPHRAEVHGVDSLNTKLQSELTNDLMKRAGDLKGITLNDKVIQIQNRTGKQGLWAYDTSTGSNEQVDLFNGEIGYVKIHGLDSKDFKSIFSKHWKRINRFQVKFSQKSNFYVNYGKNIKAQGKQIDISVDDNLELAYAISVHRSQGSEFDKTFIVIPNSKRPLSAELLYTALTRAKKHCTLYVQNNISPLLNARRKENVHCSLISSSLFDNMNVVDENFLYREDWYESGKIHKALSNDMVRSKSEVIIANLLHNADIPFTYEEPLYAADGSFYLPDFTLTIRGEKFFWEHWGMLSNKEYKIHCNLKKDWYEKNFPGKLIETCEESELSIVAQEKINSIK